MDKVNSIFCSENVPGTIGGQYKATIFERIDFMHIEIWIRGDDKYVICSVVAPKVS